MAKTRTSWKKGQSGNPKGREPGTGRIEEYRSLLDPHVPALLKMLVGEAKKGNLAAMRLVLDRIYPVRDAMISDLMGEIEELRALIVARRSNPESATHAKVQGGNRGAIR